MKELIDKITRYGTLIIGETNVPGTNERQGLWANIIPYDRGRPVYGPWDTLGHGLTIEETIKEALENVYLGDLYE